MKRILRIKGKPLFMVWALGFAVVGAGHSGSAGTAPPSLVGEREARSDRHGDPLPPGAVARMGTMRLRHGDHVHQVSLSPDGKILAAACWHDFYLWDVASGRVKRREQRGAGKAVAFSRDGKALASGGQGEVVVWDSATGKELRRFQVKVERVTYLTFSSDGKTLACLGEDNTVHLLELDSGKERHQWEGPKNYIASSVAIAPDARTLAIAHQKDRLVRLYDTATGMELRQLPEHGSRPISVAFALDGKTLVSASDDTLYFWEAATGKKLRQVTPEPRGLIKAVHFAPDGKTLVLRGYEIPFLRVPVRLGGCGLFPGWQAPGRGRTARRRRRTASAGDRHRKAGAAFSGGAPARHPACGFFP